jgi:hypothetical protein
MKLAPFGRYRAFDANGKPLVGGKLYTYEAGTSTPKATYTSKTGVTTNPNPVALDANGYADVWLDTGAYKFILKDANDVQLWSVDDIDGGGAEGFASAVISKSSGFNLTINEQNNVIVCTAALTISLLQAATAGDGYVAVVINRSTGNVTIDPDGAELIDGSASLIVAPGNSVTIYCNGSAWFTSGVVRRTNLTDHRFQDGTDITKLLALNIAGITTGTTRTVTFPDKDGTLALIVGADVDIPGTNAAPSTLTLHEQTTNGTNKVVITPPAALTADVALTTPSASGTFARIEDFPPITFATTNTQVSVAAVTTWTATGLQITVTPDTTARKVKLDIAQAIYNFPAGGVADTKFDLRLKRGATVLQTWSSLGSNIASSGAVNLVDGINQLVNTVYVDSPASTSAVTYSLEMQKPSGTGVATLYAQYNNATPSNICATVF